MFRVYWINHDYYASEVFATEEQAIDYGKSKCFEFRVEDKDGNILWGWSPIGGLRRL